MDANVCGDAAEDDVPDASSLKEHIEIGPIERTFARLIDNAFSGWRSNVGNDLPAGFGTGQNFARRARDHDAGSDAPAAPLLVSRKIRKIRSMTFARMKNLERLCACRLKNALDRPDGRLGKGKIVTHSVHISSLSTEVGLHIDDNHGRNGGSQITVIRPRVRFGFDISSSVRVFRG